MKRLVNFRLSLVCAVCLVLGTISFHEFLFGNLLPLILFVVFAAATAVVFACRKSKRWLVSLVALLIFAVGFFNFYRVYADRQEWDNSSVDNAVVCGRVCDIGRNGSVQNVIYLENCTENNSSIRGRVKVIVFDGTQFATGDEVTFCGTLRKSYAVKDSVDTFAVRRNVYYELSDVTLVFQRQGKISFAEKARSYIYNSAMRFMPKNADVGYALLTSDRNALDEAKQEAFASSGIMHLLVVSGLHVGFVVTVFGLALRFFKLNYLLQLAILLVPLLFYAYICDFSPSIVRAIVMTACAYVTKCLKGRYDLLSSLCWAAFLILIFQPLYLFDVGFQLSVLSVFGIATIYLQVDRKLRKKKFNRALNWLLSTLSMSFSCVCSTFFLVALYFNKVAILGLVVNLAAIPAVFLAFVCCVVGLVPWYFHHALRLADWILQGVVVVAEFAEGLNASLPMQSSVAAVIVSVALLFVVGGYVNLGKRAKWISSVMCSVLLVVFVATTYFPKNCTNSVSVFCGYNDTMIVATSDKNDAAIVADFNDEYVWTSAKNALRRSKVEGLVLYVAHFESCNESVVRSVCETYNVRHVVVLDATGNDKLNRYFAEKGLEVFRVFPNQEVGEDIFVFPVYNGGLASSVVRVRDLKVAVVYAEGVKAKDTVAILQDVDYFVLCNGLFDGFDKNTPSITLYQHNVEGNFGANKYGNFTFTEKDGKILLSFRRTTQ